MTPEVLDLFFMEEVMRGQMLPFVQPTVIQLCYMEHLYPADFASTKKVVVRPGDYRRLVKETDFDSIEYISFENAWKAEEAKRKGT